MARNNAVCAVVISFCGGRAIALTIAALRDQVERIVVVDNGSDDETLRLLRELRQERTIDLLELGENRGLGCALNAGARFAKNNNARWILTMDQDSIADPEMVKTMLDFAEVSKDKKVISLSPTLAINNGNSADSITRKVRTAITSGNMLKLEVFDIVGPFREDYFIDAVDFEFCLRLRKYGIDVYRIGSARLSHSLGERLSIKIGLIVITVSKHSPIRKYYIFRNHCYLVSEYFFDAPLFLLKKTVFEILLILQTIFFEERRMESIRMIALGLTHFYKGIRGKL